MKLESILLDHVDYEGLLPGDLIHPPDQNFYLICEINLESEEARTINIANGEEKIIALSCIMLLVKRATIVA
mgnify:CR=1 FL=1